MEPSDWTLGRKGLTSSLKANFLFHLGSGCPPGRTRRCSRREWVGSGHRPDPRCVELSQDSQLWSVQLCCTRMCVRLFKKLSLWVLAGRDIFF